MRAIGQRDTAIEKRLAALLAQAGFTFTVQDATLPGRRILSWQSTAA
jgi:DNA mismatch endonuclease (patch repair protein)